MSGSNNNFNELNNFMNWLDENKLFDANHMSNIKILSENIEDNTLDKTIKLSDNQNIQEKEKISNGKLISKRRPKCGICKVKINVIDELISTCKCNKLHCLTHRMPESHNCEKIKEIGEEQRKNLESGLVKLSGKFEPVRI
jgi:hypothetical protein